MVAAGVIVNVVEHGMLSEETVTVEQETVAGKQREPEQSLIVLLYSSALLH